jgi:DNA-binding transcriptional MocR family regulator
MDIDTGMMLHKEPNKNGNPREQIEYHFRTYGVFIHNGKYFFMKDQSRNFIRICIAQTNESEIEEGIKRIGEAIKVLD